MQRDEKVLEVAVDAVIQRIVVLKDALQVLVTKMETEGEQSDWPSYLDSFSVLSAQICSIMKLLKNDKTPLLRNYLTLPLQLSAETDEQLLRQTEQRVPAFSHDFVPNLLRTKPEPEVEAKMTALEAKSALMNNDMGTKQTLAHNKIIKHTLDTLNHAKEEWDSDLARSKVPIYSNKTEDFANIGAVGIGKAMRTASARSQNPTPQPNPQTQPTPPMSTSKAPSSIKTNIKSAGQMHPYNR